MILIASMSSCDFYTPLSSTEPDKFLFEWGQLKKKLKAETVENNAF